MLVIFIKGIKNWGGDAYRIDRIMLVKKIYQTIYYPDNCLDVKITKGYSVKKRIVAIIMTLCLMFSLVPATVHAAQVEPLQPMWDNTQTFTANLGFSNTNGSVTVYIRGQFGVTNITADVSLFYKNDSGGWEEIEKDWEYTTSQRELTITEHFDGEAGREYKIEVSATVTMNGYTEELSKTATKVCPTN